MHVVKGMVAKNNQRLVIVVWPNNQQDSDALCSFLQSMSVLTGTFDNQVSRHVTKHSDTDKKCPANRDFRSEKSQDLLEK